MCKLSTAWNNYLGTKDLKVTTLKTEKSRYKNHLEPYWQEIDLSTIKVHHIINYRQYLNDKSLSPQSVRLSMSLLRAIIKRAIQFELMPNFIPYFEMPTVNNRRLRYLTEDEAKELMATLFIKSELWHDISLFALNTGMRAGEIFSIKPIHVNINQKTITLFETKNSHSRVIPLNNTSLSIVSKYIHKNQQYLFSDNKIKEVSSIFNTTVKKLNLNSVHMDRRERIVFHSLRHTFASWLIQQGTPLLVVSSLLGHKDIKMAMRYSHLSPCQEKQAVDKIFNSISVFESQ